MPILINCPKEVKEKIRYYYKSCPLYITRDIKFRYIKIRDCKGKFHQFTVRSELQLRNKLIRYCPVDIYYSSSAFLNPNKVNGKLTKNLHFLYQDLIIDIDEEFNKSLEIAKGIIKTLGNPEYIIRTSKNGIQMSFGIRFKNRDLPMSIQQRINQYNTTYKQIAEQFEGIDKDISSDLFRVVRLPLSIHREGNIVQFLDIQKPKDLKYIFTDNIILPKSRKAMTEEKNFPSQNNGSNSRLGIRDTAPYSANYISNNILGTKGLYIPILIYHKDYQNINQELKELMKKYEIPKFYILKDEEYLYAISLIAMDSKRLNKLLNCSNSLLSQKMFNNYKQIYMRISPYSYSKEDKIKPFGIINYQTNKKLLLSKSHIPALLSLGLDITDKGKYIGKSEVKVTTTTWK